MKTSEFTTRKVNEDLNIGLDAHKMHQEHEIQLARKNCYEAAENAIELHKLLGGHVEKGVEPWVTEKLALAADYLRNVKEHLLAVSAQASTLPVTPGEGPGPAIAPPTPAPTMSMEAKKTIKKENASGGASSAGAMATGTVPSLFKGKNIKR